MGDAGDEEVVALASLSETRGKGNGERAKGKGQREKGKGFKSLTLSPALTADH